MKYYLLGILGTGMASLAILLKERGHFVIGSDTGEYYFTKDKLDEHNIEVLVFNKKNIEDDYFYIIGSAYDDKNIEVKEIIKKGYNYKYYYDFIGSNLGLDIYAVSGTHGKTTTTWFLKSFLEDNCNYIIGDGTGHGVNNKKLVLEACEYKNHFLSYNPKVLLINNIELDHTDFFKSKKDLINSFQSLANKSEIVIVNGDDKLCKKIKHQKLIKFGFSKRNDIIIKILSKTSKGYYIQIQYDKNYYVKVPFLGKHYIYDFVGAYIMCIIMKEKPSIKNLSLPKRRFEEYVLNDAVLIDDYAHHPTEIKCLYETIKGSYPDKKINVIFQSHTYERTLYFKKEFCKVLDLFDEVYLMDVFSSKRENLSKSKQEEVDKVFIKYKRIDALDLNLVKNSTNVWVFLGAGVANNLLKQIINEND